MRAGTGHQGWGHMVSPREARSSRPVECSQLGACARKCEKWGVSVGAICLLMDKDPRGTGMMDATGFIWGEGALWANPNMFRNLIMSVKKVKVGRVSQGRAEQGTGAKCDSVNSHREADGRGRGCAGRTGGRVSHICTRDGCSSWGSRAGAKSGPPVGQAGGPWTLLMSEMSRPSRGV